MIRLLLILLFVTGFSQDALVKGRASFEKQLGEVDSSYTDLEKKKLLVRATVALQRLQSGFQAAGEFTSIQAVQKEQARLGAQLSVGDADLVDVPPALRSFQEKMKAGLAQIDEEALRRKAALHARYRQSLQAYQKKVTIAGDLDTAAALQKELERIGRADLATRPATPGPRSVSPPGLAAGAVNLGDGFVEFRGRVYRFMGHEPLHFGKAVKRAEALGGAIACLNTRDEFAMAGTMVGLAACWVGAAPTAGPNSRFAWLNDGATEVEGWAEGESKALGENRAALAGNNRMNRDSGSAKRLITLDQYALKAWLAEWPSRAAAANAVKEIQTTIADVKAKGTPFGAAVYSPSLQGYTALGAVDFCHSLGATMAYPAGAEEEAFLRDLSGESIWIGVTDDMREGTWTTYQGAPLKRTFWSPGEPNGGNREHYGKLRFAADKGASWLDNPILPMHRFILKWQ